MGWIGIWVMCITLFLHFRKNSQESDSSSVQVSESEDQNMEGQFESTHEQDLDILHDGEQVRW